MHAVTQNNKLSYVTWKIAHIGTVLHTVFSVKHELLIKIQFPVLQLVLVVVQFHLSELLG